MKGIGTSLKSFGDGAENCSFHCTLLAHEFANIFLGIVKKVGQTQQILKNLPKLSGSMGFFYYLGPIEVNNHLSLSITSPFFD